MGTQTTSALVTPASLIKPQLRNLSGSGKRLRGVIVERDLESPLSGVDTRPGVGSKHVLVLPSRSAARLEWTAAGCRRKSLYRPNDLILNPAGYATSPQWDAPIELILFSIDPKHLVTTSEEAGASSDLELQMKFQFQDKLLEQLVRTLAQQFEQEVPADSLYTSSLAHTLLLHLIRTHTNITLTSIRPLGSVSEPRVRRAIEFIQEHLSQALSLEQIARETNLNSSQFCYIFKTAMGVSPHQYVLRQRLERAIGLLRETKLPVSEIAARTGFADQSHLTRLMRQHRGVTRGQVRQHP
jgi:AraC family transcriptional regulator